MIIKLAHAVIIASDNFMYMHAMSNLNTIILVINVKTYKDERKHLEFAFVVCLFIILIL